MDRNEYKIKVEQIRKYVSEGKLKEAEKMVVSVEMSVSGNCGAITSAISSGV